MALDAELNSRKEYTNFWRSFSDFNPRHQAGINEEEAFKVITDVKNRDKNLVDCLSGIKSLTPYLSCSNEKVRNYAAQVVSALLSKTSNFSGFKVDSDTFMSFSQSPLNQGLMDISGDEFISGMEKITDGFIGKIEKDNFILDELNSVGNIFKNLTDSLRRITELFKNGWVKTIVQSIMGADLGVSSLDSALGAISSVSKYLSYDSEEIKTAALQTILVLIEKAANYLNKESDPQKILRAAAILLGVIQGLEKLHSKGEINLSKADLGRLAGVKELVFEKIKSLENDKNYSFVFSSKNPGELKLNDSPSDKSGCENKYSGNNPSYSV